MNAIIGFSDLLADEDLTAAEKENFISKIRLSGESLLNLINDIIDIAKIEAGQLSIVELPCEIDQLLFNLEGTFSEIRLKTQKEGLQLKLTIPPRPEPLIAVTDPMRLQQVMSNLLANALKFTDSGEVEFGYQEKENEIIFFVRDTGIGILENNQDMLFQRFSQVDGSSTRKYGGTGLGLAISKNIVEMMGGRIWVESEYGKGSVFRFSIPLRSPDAVGEKLTIKQESFNWKEKTILIAEDQEQNFILLAAILRFTRVSILHAVNGQEAIDLVKENPEIDMVLMDIQLPLKTGYEAIREIRMIRPELPIISLTAFALPNEREKSLAAGCVDYFSKPVSAEVLVNALRKFLDPIPAT